MAKNLSDKEKLLFKQIKELADDYPNIKRYAVIFAISVIGVPLIIWLLYFVGGYVPLFKTGINAGDLLGYWGAILAFLGTIVFSALAVWQNQQMKKNADDSNEISKRMLALEEMQYMPIVNMHKNSVRIDCRRINIEMRLSFINSGKIDISKIHIVPMDISQAKILAPELEDFFLRKPYTTVIPIEDQLEKSKTLRLEIGELDYMITDLRVNGDSKLCYVNLEYHKQVPDPFWDYLVGLNLIIETVFAHQYKQSIVFTYSRNGPVATILNKKSVIKKI